MSGIAASAARIVGLGAVSPLGLSAPATFAALRAGLARISEIGSFAVAGPDAATQALMGGRVPLELFDGMPEGELTEWPGHRRAGLPEPPALASLVEDGPDRLVRMLRPALEEAIADAAWGSSTTGVHVWIAVDPSDADDATATALRAACAAVLDSQTVPLVDVTITPTGRAGSLANLDAAARTFGRTGGKRALIAGVGSLIRPREAAALDAHGNLRSAERPLGIHPGECAAAVAISPFGAPRSSHRRVAVGPVATSRDATARGEPTDARALSSAIRTALDGAGGGAPRPLVVCDLNGDRYRGLEWAIALVRTLGEVHGEGDVWHPAEGIGDAGAGLGALVLAWAAHALDAGHAGASRVLAWGASDDGLRVACTLGTGD
jgi:3-oxoacyl-[acyl-carrier-protein] synthase-1